MEAVETYANQYANMEPKMTKDVRGGSGERAGGTRDQEEAELAPKPLNQWATYGFLFLRFLQMILDPESFFAVCSVELNT